MRLGCGRVKGIVVVASSHSQTCHFEFSVALEKEKVYMPRNVPITRCRTFTPPPLHATPSAGKSEREREREMERLGEKEIAPSVNTRYNNRKSEIKQNHNEMEFAYRAS